MMIIRNCFLILLCALSIKADYLVDALASSIQIPDDIYQQLNAMPSSAHPTHYLVPPHASQPYLFQFFPKLSGHIAHMPLGNLPTPIRKLEKISAFKQRSLYMKFDGLTAHITDPAHQLYGGNKIRKLEFLLADALAHGAQAVMTFGSVGSNHCLATATYAHKVGLDCLCFLKPQPKEAIIRRNLLLHATTGSRLHYFQSESLRDTAAVYLAVDYQQQTGVLPYAIPYGGSSPIGILGILNGACELYTQIKANLIPEPDYIFVAIGSSSTFCGLTLGCKLLGLKTKVIGVPIEPIDFEPIIRHKLKLVNRMIHTYDPDIHLYDWQKEPLAILTGYEGADYGVFTKEGLEAIELIQETEKVELDGVYTGKACAAMFDYIDKHATSKDTILFWNTFCSLDFSQKIQGIDYHTLPHALHTYFE